MPGDQPNTVMDKNNDWQTCFLGTVPKVVFFHVDNVSRNSVCLFVRLFFQFLHFSLSRQHYYWEGSGHYIWYPFPGIILWFFLSACIDTKTNWNNPIYCILVVTFYRSLFAKLCSFSWFADLVVWITRHMSPLAENSIIRLLNVL